MKRNIKDILHSADSSTLERIAERGKAADSETASRIYDKCLARMDKDTEHTEFFTAEPVRRAPRFAPALIAAASVFIVLGAVGLALKFKAPAPKPVDVSPVIAATGTTGSSTNDEYRISDTTETRAVSISEDGTKDTDISEEPVTTFKPASDKTMTTVTASGGFVTTNTTAKNSKTTAKTTKNSSKTTTTKTVTTAKSNEKRMTLAEIEEWERKNAPSTLVRERAILNGEISADSPRVTLAQIKQFIAESSNFNEIYRKIRDIQPYPDVNGGSGVTLIEYWVNGSRNDYVLLCPENMSIYVMDENSKRAEELYTEPRVTTPPVTNKPEYAGEITLDEVLKLAQNSQNMQYSDFRKYCYSADHYDDSDMKFIISDREKWYLVVNANKGGSGVICSIWDNICNYRMNIRSTPYDDIVDNINGWTYKDAVTISPVAGKISIDDVIRIHNEKGESLDPSDFAEFTYEDFDLNGNHIVKYRVVDGEKYKVSKVNEVYLTLLLGNGRPLISASLHDQNFIYNSQLINTSEYYGTFNNSIDGELENTKTGTWFLDNK